MANLFDDLLRSSSSEISPTWLESVGKKAAADFVEAGVPLNTTIMKMASGMPGVNQEHIRRIVEFANNSTYLGVHEKFKEAGSKHSYPRYKLADVAEIMHGLTDSNRSVRVSQADSDYSKAPPKVNHQEKVASIDKRTAPAPTRHGVLQELEKKAQQYGLVAETAAAHVQTKLADVAEAEVDFIREVREYLADGGQFAGVVDVVTAAGGSASQRQELLKVAVAEGFRSRLNGFQTKTAGIATVRASHLTADAACVNPEHPLFKIASAIVALSTDAQAYSLIAKENAKARDEIVQFIRSNT
jgi:hypothetical protein